MKNLETITENKAKPMLCEVRFRSLSDILKEADNLTDLQILINLWNEIANNKYKYPLAQIWFANEHLRKLVLKADAPDIKKGKFYMALIRMYQVDCNG